MSTTLPDSRQADARPGWLEARRFGKLAQAEADNVRADAAQQRRFAAAEHARKLRNADRADRRRARGEARRDFSERLAGSGDWCKRHTGHLLMVPVIGVPGALAADGQARWGIQQYGPAGVILPAFSEGSMWVFAAKTAQARKDNPDAPVWHLRLGTVVFALIGAAMNFAHGMAAGGIWQGLTMAVTSVSGVTAHQITTAGPRRTRQQRRNARNARRQARLEARVMKAAIDDGTVVIAADGRSRVNVRPGAVTLRRTWHGTRLDAARDVQAEIDDAVEAALVMIDGAQAAHAAAVEAADTAHATAGTAIADRDEARALVQRARRERDAADALAKEAKAGAARAERAAETAAAERDRAAGQLDAAVAERDTALHAARQARAEADDEAHRAAQASARADQADRAAQQKIDEIGRTATERVTRAQGEQAAAAQAAGQARQAAEDAITDLARERALVQRAQAERDAAIERARIAEDEIADIRSRQRQNGESKKEHLLRLYRAHPDYRDPARASRTATELAAVVGLTAGTARNNVNEHLREVGPLVGGQEGKEVA